jgi:hypothetical protein
MQVGKVAVKYFESDFVESNTLRFLNKFNFVIKIILMSLNEHCLHIFNCLLRSLFIYVYLTFKLPTQLVVFPFGDYLLS